MNIDRKYTASIVTSSVFYMNATGTFHLVENCGYVVDILCCYEASWFCTTYEYDVKYRCCIMTNKVACHYCDAKMGAMASQITSLTIVYSTVHSNADQRKHQGSASLAFVLGMHRWPVNSPHKWPMTRKMFPFDDVIMYTDDVDSILQLPVFYKITMMG